MLGIFDVFPDGKQDKAVKKLLELDIPTTNPKNKKPECYGLASDVSVPGYVLENRTDTPTNETVYDKK